MQQGKDRLTGRFAAYSNKHQLKHRGKKKKLTSTTDFIDHH